MKGLKEFIDAMLGRTPPPLHDDDKVLLDAAEKRVAGRLSKMTGKTRDEVLAESYRRADALRMEAESVRKRG